MTKNRKETIIIKVEEQLSNSVQNESGILSCTEIETIIKTLKEYL